VLTVATAFAYCVRVLAAGQLIVCGSDDLFILNLNKTPPEKVWKWNAATRPDLPETMRGKFRTIAECKPVEDGDRILIAASSNGAAVIERKTGKVAFYATVFNAHSIEMLPAGRVVVASSHVPSAPGDRLIVFDLSRPVQEVFHTELLWAHGVVWDPQRELLWALSDKELRAYKLVDWNSGTPALAKDVIYKLPDDGGHNLSAVPGTAMLSVSTAHRSWLFDRDRREFAPHPDIGDYARVKCIDVDPLNQRLVWVQAQGDNWWSDKLQLLHPTKTIQLPGERIYKARWLSTGSAGSPR
jgi:hypothetical protein